jgi:hypothetical protein
MCTINEKETIDYLKKLFKYQHPIIAQFDNESNAVGLFAGTHDGRPRHQLEKIEYCSVDFDCRTRPLFTFSLPIFKYLPLDLQSKLIKICTLDTVRFNEIFFNIQKESMVPAYNRRCIVYECNGWLNSLKPLMDGKPIFLSRDIDTSSAKYQ